jgi:hypothetical protein
MELADKIEDAIYLAEQHPAEDKGIPACIVGLSDPALLRLGVNAKLHCSEAENPDEPRLKTLLLQLMHARAEWNRRHPKLPLRDSF